MRTKPNIYQTRSLLKVNLRGYEIIEAKPLAPLISRGSTSAEFPSPLAGHTGAAAFNQRPVRYVARIHTAGDKGRLYRSYDPMGVTTFSQQFLKTVVLEADVVAFANRFGNLHEGVRTVTVEEYERLLLARENPEGLFGPIDAEAASELKVKYRDHCVPLEDWFRLREFLRDAEALWQPDSNALDRLRREFSSYREQLHQSQGRLRSMDFWAFHELSLDAYMNTFIRDPAELGVALRSSRRQIALVPRTLRAALWTRLARRICKADRPTRVCLKCNGISAGRRDKVFCSDRCRKAFRREEERKAGNARADDEA